MPILIHPIFYFIDFMTTLLIKFNLSHTQQPFPGPHGACAPLILTP